MSKPAARVVDLDTLTLKLFGSAPDARSADVRRHVFNLGAGAGLSWSWIAVVEVPARTSQGFDRVGVWAEIKGHGETPEEAVAAAIAELAARPARRSRLFYLTA